MGGIPFQPLHDGGGDLGLGLRLELGGGFRAKGSFVEFAKDLIDRMHSWYTEDDAGFPLHPMAREQGSIAFHDSLIVLKKQIKQPPISITSQNGKIGGSRKILEVRGRKSIF